MGDLYDEVEEDVGTVPSCSTCGSERVVRPAWLCWNRRDGAWELESELDLAYCHACGGNAELTWQETDGAKPVKRVRELNDLFRTSGVGGGTIVVTSGIEDLGPKAVVKILTTVREFSEFPPESDPWEEHDFGAFDYEEQRIFWKIDCYDLTKTMGSPNPANLGVTHRVLTIMLASEY